MKKTIITLMLAAIMLMTACSRGTNSSQYTDDAASDSSEATDSLTEEDGGSSAGTTDDFAPVGTQPAETTADEGVTIKDEYDYLRNLTDYDGEYVSLDQMGYEYYTLENEALESIMSEYSTFGISKAFFDKERIYLVSSVLSTFVCVVEYNMRTGESALVEMPENCNGIEYIDSDYVFYYDMEEFLPGTVQYYCLLRETGEVHSISELDGVHIENLTRIGIGFYFNTYDDFNSSDENLSIELCVLNRYIPNQNYLTKIEANAKILGSSEDSLVMVTEYDTITQMDVLGGKTYMTYLSEELYSDGEYIGYISPFDESILGARYEVGRITPELNYNNSGYRSYKSSPFFRTYLGSTIEMLTISGQEAAAFYLANADHTVSASLLMDTVGGQAAVVSDGYSQEICCDGDWLYFINYDERIITSVNTLRQ